MWCFVRWSQQICSWHCQWTPQWTSGQKKTKKRKRKEKSKCTLRTLAHSCCDGGTWWNAARSFFSALTKKESSWLQIPMPPGVQRAWLALASLLAPSDTMWKINVGFWWRTSAQKGSFQLCRCTVTGTNPGSVCKRLCVHYNNINICNFFY